jgi:hypothetical protein
MCGPTLDYAVRNGAPHPVNLSINLHTNYSRVAAFGADYAVSVVSRVRVAEGHRTYIKHGLLTSVLA